MTDRPNTLYYGDNLDILRRYIHDESVDLIYLDPPFNSNADYNVLFAEKSGEKAHSQIRAFEDTWTWDLGAAQEYAEVLRSGHDRVARALKGMYEFLGGTDMLAYLSMMALRLIELRRVLKPTGSIYLHCDPTASHYLKIIMDAVFGPENFRSEIIWKRNSGHNKLTRQYGPIHDVILFYARTDETYFQPGTRPLMRGYVREWFTEEDANGRFRTNMLTGPGTRTGESGKPWHGFDPTSVGRHWAIPSTLAKQLQADASDWTTQEKLDWLNTNGWIYIPRDGKGQPKYKQYVSQGTPYQDVWACQPYTEGTLYQSEECIDADVKWLGHEKERLPYPTQKPEGLLERIIRSSSPDGAVVLDPFCGCGTTIATAQRLNRRWVGIDITHLAINLIKVRLADAFGPKIAETYTVIGEPTDLAGARALAEQDKYQFQYWALGLVNARPVEEKKGSDRGIDGRLYITDREGETKSSIISVKGGHVNPSQVRDLIGTVQNEDAAIGVFITLEAPTKSMREAAASAGMWQTKSLSATSHPRLQILTIEDLLAGKKIDMPAAQDIRSFKQAPKAKAKKRADAGLF